jgi:hypothetical protein
MGTIRALLGLMLAFGLVTFAPVGASGATQAGSGTSYTAQLSGGEEVPARNTPASGQATFQVSADGTSMTYSVTVSNITNVIAGHIHIAPKGSNGDIVLPLVPMASPGGGPKSGVIGQGTVTAEQLIGPMTGKSLLDLVAQMDAGNAYVNIHTASGASPATQMAGDIPPGEIRGQIVVAAAPVVMPSAGGGYAARGASPLRRFVLLVLCLVGVTVVRRALRRRA